MLLLRLIRTAFARFHVPMRSTHQSLMLHDQSIRWKSIAAIQGASLYDGGARILGNVLV